MKKFKKVKRQKPASYKEQARLGKRNKDKPSTFRTTQKKKTQKNLLLFIQTIRQTACVSTAAAEVGISTRLSYVWKKDPELKVTLENGESCTFKEAWEEALEFAIDKLEREARKWALDGQPESVVYQGQQAWLRDPETMEIKRDVQGNPIPLTIHVRSPRMMEILLKAHRPKFREKPPAEEQKGSAGVLVIPMAQDDEAWEQLAELQQRVHREKIEQEAS